MKKIFFAVWITISKKIESPADIIFEDFVSIDLDHQPCILSFDEDIMEERTKKKKLLKST